MWSSVRQSHPRRVQIYLEAPRDGDDERGACDLRTVALLGAVAVSPPAWRAPQYWIEHRRDDESPLIVAFVANDLGLRSALAMQVARHLRNRARATLVVVDQETEKIVSVRKLLAVR